ncbi:MAG: dynamin family protein [Solirubrobacteraceae bacterium]
MSVDGGACTRADVLAALDELVALAGGLLPAGSVRDVEAARVRLDEDLFNLVVLGEFKRGKSTLINALLGRDLLPTGVVPLTTAITIVGFGPVERLTVQYEGGRRRQHPLDELAEYVTEALNPGNRLGVEAARIALPDTLLAGGLQLVDTPGIGSIHSHNTEAARGFLPKVDAALCVLDAGQPLTESERELFIDAAARVPRLLFVVNKVDHLEADEVEASTSFLTGALRELIGAEPELFGVSARRRIGLEALTERLRQLATHERDQLLTRSVSRLAHAAAVETARAARFETRATELPLEELERKADQFERRISELREAGAEAADLLAGGVRRAISNQVDAPLSDYARSQEPRLRAALDQRVRELGRVGPRALSTELERWIDATVRNEFEQLVPRFEREMADLLTELETGYAARVRRVLEDVQAAAADIFGAPAADVLPDAGLRAPSRFSFKLTDVEHALDVIVGFGRTVTPGAFGRRLVVRDAETRLIEMTDRHAGRLRSELAERVAAAEREYRRELGSSIDEAIDAIHLAISRAADERRAGERPARERVRELGRIAQRSDELAAWFGVLSDAPTRHDDGLAWNLERSA